MKRPSLDEADEGGWSTAMPAKATVADRDLYAPVRRRRRWPWLAGAALLLLLLAAAAWLALGLLGAARDARAAATQARADLQRSARALRAGDEASARRGIRAANLELARADAAARRTPVRVAGRLPVLSSPVDDLHHLLTAGHILAGTANQAVTVQARFADTGILRDGRINLAVVATTLNDTNVVLGQLERARRELERVRGGWLAPGAAAARDASLRQLDEIEGQLRPINDVVRTLPAAIGSGGPRTYLVAVSNSAELKAWGGAPLAIALLRLDHGQVSVLRRGALSEQQLRGRIAWDYVPGDPWHPPGSLSLFSSSGLSPNFPTSGEEILRAFQKLTGVRADGVIALDPTALAGMLRVSGPVTTPGFGKVNGDYVVRLLLADSYRRYPDTGVRRGYNQQLMDAVMARLLHGGDLLRQVRGLGAAAAGRHLQLYFRDRRLQEAASAHGLAGALSPASQDYLGVFTINSNASKTDYFQRRQIQQRVRLAADGSARVDRAIRLDNTADAQPGFDPRTGYTTGWARPQVASYLPGAATGISVQVDGKPMGWSTFRELGRLVVRARLWLPPRSTHTVTVSYRLARAAVRTGDGLRYQLVVDPQPIVNPATLRVVVVPPSGLDARAHPGWSEAHGGLVATRRFISGATFNLDLSH
jgi:Protein of unknown function (DUF4012)